MAKYEFEPNALFHRRDSADPDIVGAALETLIERHGGRLKPTHVVEAARSRSHPLHPHFEWSDKRAADAHRLDQARAIIRSVRIVADEVNAESARAYHSINDEGRAYHAVAEVMTSALLQIQLQKQALRELMAFEQRYRRLGDICALVSVARGKLEHAITELEAKAAAEPRRPRARSDKQESRPTA